MRLSHQIVIATTNLDKFEEFRSLFRAYPEVELKRLDEVIRNAQKIGLVEKYKTYEENAVAKARIANHGAHFPCLADDSGLEVEALHGKPGVKSARFAIPKAGQSQDQANVNKLLEELKGRPMDVRKARFTCTLAIVMEGIMLHATGELKGRIAEAPAGEHGFGYDPVFIPEGTSRTLAQMNIEEKNRISHRAKALENLMVQVRAKGIVFAKP